MERSVEPEQNDIQSMEEVHINESEKEVQGSADEEVHVEEVEAPPEEEPEEKQKEPMDEDEAAESAPEEEPPVQEETEEVVEEVVEEVPAESEQEEEVQVIEVEEEEEEESEEEFTVEDCYAYATGFKGKVAKKALLKAFGQFGTIVGVKQVQKKCRIQYSHPSAVVQLINCDPPFEFNGKVLTISRTLVTKSKKGKGSSRRKSKKWKTQRESSQQSGGRGQSEDEVEAGRGVSEDEEDSGAEAVAAKKVPRKKATSKKKNLQCLDERPYDHQPNEKPRVMRGRVEQRRQ